MRKLLATSDGERKKFAAVFARFGKKINYKGYSEMTVLLQNIIDTTSNEVVADHLWFGYTSGFEKASIKEGCRLEFEARVKQYSKGYVNPGIGAKARKKDFKLSNPTRIKVVEYR